MASSWFITATAAQEIESIVLYLDRRTGGTAAAENLMAKLIETLDSVASFPQMFDLCPLPEVRALGYRSFTVGRYVVLYTVRDEAVYVAHAFHGSRDYGRLVAGD